MSWWSLTQLAQGPGLAGEDGGRVAKSHCCGFVSTRVIVVTETDQSGEMLTSWLWEDCERD